MQFTLATIALAAATVVSAQGISSVITPTAAAPAGCSTDYAGSFEITVVLPSKKRDLEKRAACASDGTLVATLKGSVLTDAKSRIGAIVANHQFQFDGPPSQEGSIYTGGFSVCGNGSLALGGSNIFYQCKSGSFYNLYDEASGAQCEEVVIDIIPCGSATGSGEQTDGQPTGAGATQVTDGQVQATSAVAGVSQITDGQVQATSAAAGVSQISDGQVQASSAAAPLPVSQFTDGQIQVTASPAPAPVSQISDGQIQATSAPVASFTVAPVSQISDGQIQATSAAAPVSQISDGQIQATAASNATVAPSTVPFSGASQMVGASFGAIVVAIAAVAML